MRRRMLAVGGVVGLCGLGVAWAAGSVEVGRPAAPQGAPDRASQNAAWMDTLARVHQLDEAQQNEVARIVNASELLSQGNPALTMHPMQRAECAEKLAAAGETWDSEDNQRICGGPYMAPLYDPATQTAEDATV